MQTKNISAELTYPILTIGILKEIIKDGVNLSPHIHRVGLIGSYARGDYHDNSDIDLLLDVPDVNYNETMFEFGHFVEHVLDYQFNKKLNIVRYTTALNYAAAAPKAKRFWYYQEGYKKMLQDVVWLYER
ncbi:MAG: nucleotidyltransferase domain-containing protein [Firmicutes bacterium]|nr:nucleotidyltransferase domain-containing protein [Bacillota bacterium]